MTAYPPQPSIHPAARGTVGITVEDALAAHPYAFPAGGLREWPRPGTRVEVVPATHPPHDYRTSMVWPANADRALCAVCRGTHP